MIFYDRSLTIIIIKLQGLIKIKKFKKGGRKMQKIINPL